MHIGISWKWALCLWVSWIPTVFAAQPAGWDTLRQQFLHPPSDCWPHTRWWWFGSAVTKEEIRWELEQMRDKGILGVEQISMSPVYEKGNIPYLSDEFLELLRYTVMSAKQLGMQVSINFGGPGWIIGGDWVPQQDRMKDLVPTFIDLQGPQQFSGALPKKLTRTNRSWEIPVPELNGEERLLAVVVGKLVNETIEPNSITLLTDRIKQNSLQWSVPPGRWRLMAFWLKYHDQGNAVDHMSQAAMQRYCDYIGGKFYHAFGEEFGKTVDSFFCDSFEVPNLPSGFYWSEGLLESFQEIKGYDLTPHLPALWWPVGELSEKVRYDVNEFLHQVGMKAFFQTFLDWCQAHHVQGRIQPYGFTTDVLESAGVTHIPETEICPGEKDAVPWFDTRIGPAKYTSSGAHLYGRNLITVEAYTFIHWEPFRATLEELKIASDGHLRHGANKFYNHGYSYSPERGPTPGRGMSPDANISHINTWWQYYPMLSRYLARCCYLLRQGDFAPDVALYSPLANQWTLNVLNARKWTREFDWGELGQLLIANGYDFDLINDDVLQHRAKIVDGQIHVGPLNYKILILPNLQAMPLETLHFIQQYVQQGGVVIALERVPDRSTGLADYAQKDHQVQALVREMFDQPVGDDGTAPKQYGRGRTYHIKRVINRQDVLDRRSSSLDPFVNTLRDHLPPDFSIDFALQGLRENRGLTFLHRKMNQDDLYFVSNIQDQVSTIPVTFRVTDRVPWKWNPYTGEVTPLHTYTVKQGGIEIPLRLQPYESLFIVFTPGRQMHASQSSLHEIQILEPHRMIGSAQSNGPFLVTLTDGVVSKTVQGSVAGLPAPLLINGDWRMVFLPSGSINLDTTFTQLFSWTKVSRTRHFSGSGVYELTFTAPSVYVKEDLQLFLDLGRVGDIAEVTINGQKAGVVWMRGQTLDVTGLIRAGSNRLSVTVTNTLINRVSGMKEAPPVPEDLMEHYGRSLVTASAGPRSPMSFTALPASGLLGPVRLVVYKKIDCPL